MAYVRDASEIVKGSKLMVFIGGSAIGFATSHSLSLTLNTSEVSTKDHGDATAVVPNTISWEVTAENLYSTTGAQTYMQNMLNKTKVTLKFAAASNYDSQAQTGIVGEQGAQPWNPSSTATDIIAEGTAYITSCSVNAPAGDNATLSVTFTGVGGLKSGMNGTQGS